MTYSACIILAIAVLSSLTVFWTCLDYILACKAKEVHHAIDAPSRDEDETAYNSWLKTGQFLEHKRTTTGAVTLIAYVLSIICLIQTPHPTNEIVDFISLMVTLVSMSLPVLMIRSIEHHDRIEKLDLRNLSVVPN